jgi:hypothetical protein
MSAILFAQKSFIQYVLTFDCSENAPHLPVERRALSRLYPDAPALKLEDEIG